MILDAPKRTSHALNIQVDEHHKLKDYGQVINYQLTDLPQKLPGILIKNTW
jgi:hypothetical protein